VGLSSLMFGLGLIDDIWGLRPRSKLLVQLLVAGLVLSCGIVYRFRENPFIDFPISLIWIVGITNAFNLLDNMDGLAAGVGAGIARLARGLFRARRRLPLSSQQSRSFLDCHILQLPKALAVG
jgi:UDP-GlcNAc:undecaprenyl-phosphate GlcNAc-1-phosphate transferase